MSKEDRKLTDFEQLEALLYRIIRKLNVMEISVDDAAHGYYKEKKRTSGLTSKIKALREELGIEEPARKYPRVNEPNYLPGQSITSKFRPELEFIDQIKKSPWREEEPDQDNVDVDEPEEIEKRKEEGQ